MIKIAGNDSPPLTGPFHVEMTPDEARTWGFVDGQVVEDRDGCHMHIHGVEVSVDFAARPTESDN